jgi:hypothetical protein
LRALRFYSGQPAGAAVAAPPKREEDHALLALEIVARGTMIHEWRRKRLEVGSQEFQD